jgi:hypothetical protein
MRIYLNTNNTNNTYILISLLCLLLLTPSAQTLAWSLFEKSSEYEEVELSSAEWSQVEVAAGWAPGDKDTLLFALKNKLAAPISCAGALVNLNNGKSVKRGLVPRLYVPSAMVKQFSVAGVTKETLKDYSVTCSCTKKPGSKQCINPFLDKKK